MIQPFMTLKRKLFRLAFNSGVKLRYRVVSKGLDKLDPDPDVGTLILPNHTSHFDTFFVMIDLYPRFQHFRIWLSDFACRIKWAQISNRYLYSMHFIEVPTERKHELKKDPEEYKRALDRLFQRSADCLLAKKNVILHASGGSKKTPKEIITHTRGVKEILKRCPNANILLIRETGMWGSRMSHAQKKDPRWKTENHKWNFFFRRLIEMLLLNGIFFIPKRTIEIEYVMNPPDFPREGTADEMNEYMEKFYNAKWGPEGEPFNYVPDFFWQSRELKDKSIIAEPQTHH
ncbi:MAG: 1-acyl-sn-glycerol-3-phosphate acyltransferase [Chlamydiia bacterium]|nr:1-acyl-sn-glycerol-3-phosphate acyltransferase [Chlamydiia bacterium]